MTGNGIVIVLGCAHAESTGHLGYVQTPLDFRYITEFVVLQADKMPSGAGLLQRPINEQIDELKSKIALLGKSMFCQPSSAEIFVLKCLCLCTGQCIIESSECTDI
jgi:hypothetical protein